MARHRTYGKYTDLRQLLNEKHHNEGPPSPGPSRQSNRRSEIPTDPPSILQDPLRGDYVKPREHSREVPQRGYRRRYGGHQPRYRGSPRRGEGGSVQNHANIKVELSESGERKCCFDLDKDVSDRFRQETPTNRSGRGYRGRRSRIFRGRFRGGASHVQEGPPKVAEDHSVNKKFDRQEYAWDVEYESKRKDKVNDVERLEGGVEGENVDSVNEEKPTDKNEGNKSDSVNEEKPRDKNEGNKGDEQTENKVNIKCAQDLIGDGSELLKENDKIEDNTKNKKEEAEDVKETSNDEVANTTKDKENKTVTDAITEDNHTTEVHRNEDSEK